MFSSNKPAPNSHVMSQVNTSTPFNNPSIISQGASLLNMNPSLDSQKAPPLVQQNQQMMMMANMMMASQQPGSMDQNQLMFQQFQNFLKQNPQFLMQQMKMMGMQAPMGMQMPPVNTHSTQSITPSHPNQTNPNPAKSVSMNHLPKKDVTNKGIKNLHRLRDKEKTGNKIIGNSSFLSK